MGIKNIIIISNISNFLNILLLLFSYLLKKKNNTNQRKKIITPTKIHKKKQYINYKFNQTKNNPNKQTQKETV